ncbi:MAG TPA: alcohol dehydrogenase catalytic domain-containing protein [Thermodesulfobacteriota bacterium]|nr:alcohol dehydrogenase catalytic domain-containing protein [Thermodesulfobacteriota bacterium]
MKAVVYRRPSGLVLEEVPKPQVADNEVLIHVADTGFCGSDHSMVESGLVPDGYILGHETSGVIEALGKNVRGLETGWRVMIRPTFCGQCRYCLAQKPHLCMNQRRTIGVGDLPGGFAEYVKVFPQMVIPIPEGVDSQSAALVETFASALHGIRRSGVRGGSLLVLGGGPIGLAAIQVAGVTGFSPIALSEPVETKRALGRRFGANFTADPLSENMAARTAEWTQNAGFDLVLECSGVPGNVQAAVDAAAKGGTVGVVSVFFKPVTLQNPLVLFLKEVSVIVSASNTHEENYQCLDWLREKKLDAASMISDRTSLADLPRVYRERIHTGKVIKAMVRIGEAF